MAGANPAPGASADPGQSQLVPAAIAPWARTGHAGPGRPGPSATAPSPSTRPAAPAAVTPNAATRPEKAPADGAAAAAAMLQQSPLAVVRWGLSAGVERQPDGGLAIAAVAGRPLDVWLTVEGGQTAIDRLRSDGHLTIELRWARDGGPTDAGAPELTTELTIGRPGLASTFAAQVQRQGHFEWHLRARKDALSPGRWSVSLTYPDGRPVVCGKVQPQPCRLSLDVS